MGFATWFEEVSSLPAKDALDRVRQAEKKPLAKLLVYDLICDGDRPLTRGVYSFFRRNGECLYVGKNSSRTFVDRIPVHLCLAEGTWMNHYVKRISKKEGLNCLIRAVGAARDHQVLLLPFSEEDRPLIGTFEKFLRLFLAPSYNLLKQRKRHLAIDLSRPLMEVLAEFGAGERPRAK